VPKLPLGGDLGGSTLLASRSSGAFATPARAR
jgi:hypothetical protein